MSEAGLNGAARRFSCEPKGEAAEVLLSAPLIKPLKRGAFDLSFWFRAGREPGFTAGLHFFNFSRNEMSCFTASFKKTRISRKLVGRDLRLIFIFCAQAVELARRLRLIFIFCTQAVTGSFSPSPTTKEALPRKRLFLLQCFLSMRSQTRPVSSTGTTFPTFLSKKPAILP